MFRLLCLLKVLALLVSSTFALAPASGALGGFGPSGDGGTHAARYKADGPPGEQIDVIGFLASKQPPPGDYTIDCEVGIENETITGTGIIRLKNNSSLRYRRLAVRWPFDKRDSIELTIDDNPLAIVSDSAELGGDRVMVMELAQPWKPGQRISLAVSFVKDLRPYFRDGGYRITAWYPRIVWGFPTCDDFDVSVAVPDGYQLVASGLKSSKTGRYQAKGVREFALFFGSGLQMIEERAGDVLVRCLHTAKGAECAHRIMETAVDVIGFYRERFGFYPSRALSIIPGSERSVGGYPVGTDVVMIHGMESMEKQPDVHWRWITAHEIAHQYWLERVLPADSKEWGWLIIGLGIYMDREYMRARGLLDDKHTGLMKRYVEGIRTGYDTRADIHPDYVEHIDFDFDNVVVHGKGYSIISALACILGENTFSRIHSRCLKDFSGRRMIDYDFQSVCEKESGRDLDWFFSQWVRSNRYPSYEIISQDCTKSGDGYRSSITINCTGTLRMPVPVLITFENGRTQGGFTDRLCDANVLYFDSATPLENATIDPTGEIALVVPPPSGELMGIRRKIENLPYSSSVKEIPSLVAEAQRIGMSDLQLWGRLALALYDWRYYEHALELFRVSCVQLKQAGSPLTPVAFGWLGIILDVTGHRKEAIEAYQEALENDTGRTFSFPEYGVTIDRTWLENRLESPFVRE